MLQEPNDDARQENDRKGPLQEVLGLFPQQPQHVLRAGQAVVRQFHHEGHRFAAEHRAPQYDCRDDPYQHAQHIDADDHQPLMGREKCGSQEAVDRQFRRAAHERRQHDGHLAVTLRRHGPGRHNARHRAAESDQQRHDGTAGKADFAQRFIHDEGDARHVSRIFQQGQEEKQDDDDGNKAQDASHTGKDAFYHQAVQDVRDACGGHPLVDRIRNSGNSGIQQVL